MYLCKHTYVHTYIHTATQASIHTHTYVHTHTYTQLYSLTWRNLAKFFNSFRTSCSIYTQLRRLAYINIHTCIYICVCVYIYIHTHTQLYGLTWRNLAKFFNSLRTSLSATRLEVKALFSGARLYVCMCACVYAYVCIERDKKNILSAHLEAPHALR